MHRGTAGNYGSLRVGDQAALERVAHEVRARGEPELLLDVRAVRLDRAHREEELPGDLRVRVAERDQAQHLDLALREVVGRAGRRLTCDPCAERGVQVGLAGRGTAHRLDQLGIGGLLEDVADRARAQRLPRVRGRILHRQHDDLRVGRLSADRRDRFEARAPGHVEVEHEHRGVVAADVAPCRVDVARLGDDLEVLLRVEQHAQPAADHGVVVGQDDADRTIPPWAIGPAVLAHTHKRSVAGGRRRSPCRRCGRIRRSLHPMAEEGAFRVVIAGGGIAALEAALALHALAGDRVAVRLLAPEPEFAYRPMTVGEPFSLPPASRYAVARIAERANADVIADRFAHVDAQQRIAHTEGGAELHYDVLLIAIGARLRAPFAHGIVIDDRRMDELFHGIVQDVEGGYVRSVAFVSGARLGWPLPLYELALLTARRAHDSDLEVEVTIVTPERAPLEVFGDQASAAVDAVLRDAGIAVVTAAQAQITEPGRVVIAPGDRSLQADRLIVMPELFGPAVRGLPAGEHGFIPTGPDGRVAGVERVYAAGDATDFPVKQGGLAAQQADGAAAAVAALAGVGDTPEPERPEIHGMLLTGGRPLWLAAHLTGGRGLDSRASDEPLWTPAGKLNARYLAPCLDALDAG